MIDIAKTIWDVGKGIFGIRGELQKARRDRLANYTGKIEGVNNKIKVIKLKAYGFHDLRYFTLKIYQAFYN